MTTNMQPQAAPKIPCFDVAGLPLYVLVSIWTILIAGFAGFDIYQDYTAAYANALAVAQASYGKDVVFRRWASMHGGVYVPATPQTPPNPYLSDLPDRDIKLPSGKILTLMNPAYMTRQVHELGENGYDIRSHITSLKPLRPQNAPDDWERGALLRFEKGENEFYSLTTLDGKPYFRYMRPLKVDATCLKCHANQGYKTGDVRGGLSASIPWTPHLNESVSLTLMGYGGIWLLGTIGIVITRRRLQKVMRAKDRLVEDLHHRGQELWKLSRAVDQSPVSIVITDTLGIIEFVNPKFTELTGYTAEEAIGQNPRILKSDQTPPQVFERLWETISSGETWEGDVLNKSKDGTLFWEHSKISPLRDETGVITHYLAVKEDITEKKNILEQLTSAKEQAEAASLAKSSFLATMSHEIRTPMNGVIGMTGLLLETGLTDEQKEFTEIVRKSGENLLTIINEILDFSKIEAGKLDLEILDFDLRVALEDTADLLALRASETGLELICRIDPAVPSHLKGDPGRLRQIIINLVGNAIKFTRKGEVVISAALKSEEDGIATILFEVIDTGIGIPESRCGAIFEPFSQADGSTTRKYGGTGLGLAICKQLAELMGGTIGVTSIVGTGSTFWFTARFEKQSLAEKECKASLHTTSQQHADLTTARILVVDDNATNRKLMTTLLDHWGCRHEVTIGGAEGLALLLEAAHAGDPFRIALLDQEMPDMDGMELGRRIKADPLLESTLLVMVTSLARRGDVVVLEQIGFVGYLPKPVRQAQLYDCLELILSRATETQSSVSHQKPQGIVTRHTLAESGRPGVRILLAEDNVINQKVAQHMLKTLGYKADVVANGQEAVRALEMINYDLVLMDCMMPVLDGFEATAVIRDPVSGVLNHAVPIIAMTANAMKGDREKCLEAGMDDYLAKPVKKEQLGEMIQRWFSNRAV